MCCTKSIHKSCLETQSKDQYMVDQEVNCPSCSNKFEREYFQYVLPGFLEQLDEELTKRMFELVSCKCGNQMAMEPGEPDYKAKDEDGVLISKKAAKHMAKFRIRCNACEINFCANCNVDPYHIGKTCEEFKEFKEGNKCRFCLDKLKKINKNEKPAFQVVCQKEECQELKNSCCSEQLNCGHYCAGSNDDNLCMPCLKEECVEKSPGLTLEVNEDDFCNLCYSSGLGQGACIQLDCKHIFHEDCLIKVLDQKWTGPRINFKFTECPSCNTRMSSNHNQVSRIISKASKLEKEIEKMALKRAKHEGIEKDE